MLSDHELARQADLCLQCEPGSHEVTFQLEGTAIPAKFRRSGNNRGLLILFHGAVDRETRPPPVFPSLIRGLDQDVAQLSVSDPSMLRPGTFSMAWYAGHHGFPAQHLLPALFQAIVDRGRFQRIVFFGGSGGGFASLFYSSLLVGSIGLAAAPQTNLHRYHPGHIKHYREGCWPALASDAQLASTICTDLCTWYATSRPNTVIYLQSAGDPFHSRTQLAPFLASIAAVQDSRFVVESGYWGKLGHSGSVTAEAFLPWLRTAFSAPSIEVNDLLETHHSLTAVAQPSGATAARAVTANVPPDPADLRMAKLLRDHHLDRLDRP